jgi:hypothetical protein
VSFKGDEEFSAIVDSIDLEVASLAIDTLLRSLTTGMRLKINVSFFFSIESIYPSCVSFEKYWSKIKLPSE